MLRMNSKNARQLLATTMCQGGCSSACTYPAVWTRQQVHVAPRRHCHASIPCWLSRLSLAGTSVEDPQWPGQGSQTLHHSCVATREPDTTTVSLDRP